MRPYKKGGNRTEYFHSPEYKRMARICALPGYKPAKHDAHVKDWEQWKRDSSLKAERIALHDSHVRLFRADKARLFRWRYAFEPEFNLRQRLRARARKYYVDAYPYKYAAVLVKKGIDSKRFYELVGYTIADLRAHLERQFTKGMTWEEFLAGRIHIDHIVPRSSFDLSDPSNIKACWCLSNLRPLWAKHNQAKKSRRTHLC